MTDTSLLTQALKERALFYFQRARSTRSEDGAPGAIPTRDLSLRRRALYATELREHVLVNRKW